MRIAVRVSVSRKVFAAGRDARRLQPANHGTPECGREVRALGQRAIADDGVRGVRMDVEDRRVVEVDADGRELRRERRRKTLRQLLVAAPAQRDCRRPLGERLLQPGHPPAFLIDAHPQRPVDREVRDLARELRHLTGLDDVPGKVDDAAEIELGDEPAKLGGNSVAGESDDRQPADVAPKLANRHSPAHYNARVRIASSAPTRIDLAGGTFDIWPLYLFHERAQTINAALSLRAHCTLTSRHDERVTLTSDDTGERVEAGSLDALTVDTLPLVARLVKHFGARGVDVRTRSESPVGAGIAGSSALNVATAGALAEWTGRRLEPDQLLNIAMNVEAQVIRVPTGVQDYRPAFYGGVSAVEMDVAGVRRVALHVDARELSRRIVVAY